MAHVWQPLPVGASRLRLVAAARHPDRYGRRRSFAAAASQRPAHRPASSQAPCVPVRSPPFYVPSVAAAFNPAERLPHRRARAAAAVPPGRGLCAWIHAPARTPAVIAACRHTAPAKNQCKLPRQLSADGLARAFAPRRATSGLVRNPPASAANGGEGRSLGKGQTPQNVGGCVSPTRVPVTRGSASRQPYGVWQV